MALATPSGPGLYTLSCVTRSADRFLSSPSTPTHAAGSPVVLKQWCLTPPPPGMPAVAYQVLLHLPGPAPSLASRYEYAIRLANQNVWGAATGFNSLQHVLMVR